MLFVKRYFIAFVLIATGSNVTAQNVTSYVDPFIGTGGHGHTFPGATVPFGMVQLSPDNGDEGWDWCSGYNYSSNTIAGFSHTHLSGTGCGDWIDISVMPNAGLIPDTGKFYKVNFSHKNETSSPGYYSVLLDNGIRASLTATDRCGFHKYVFPLHAMPVIRFDLGYEVNYDETMASQIVKINDTTIVGYRFSKGWANKQRVYFAARTSVPFRDILYVVDNQKVNGDVAQGKRVRGQMLFNDMNGQAVLMKVALSTVSTDKALLALGEITNWDFNAVCEAARKRWEHELEKITIKTNDDKLKHIFYTALYHTCMAPALYSDADGYYQNAKGKTLKMKQGQRYSVFSLWDTFRALNPLFTITQPIVYTDMLNSMLAFCDENGLLPVWDLSTYETNCMSGYHAVPVLADAVLKNMPGVNAERAYNAMKKSAFQTVRGVPDYIKYGYVPQDKFGYSVTYTLEYAYDDWCIAQVAKKLGRMDDYKLFMKRAEAYKLLFDKNDGFIHGRNADGNWVKPFDPYTASTEEGKSMYEEGNAWQYTFFVPHDVKGLANEFGSTDAFVKKLDSLFTVSSDVKGESAPPDVSGLIGQYAHGNEPSHHIAYMYSFVGQPWKTQEKVREITDSMYHAAPDGYAGNEDCGQMSAWAVWSVLGMFPANPASGEYVFGSPAVDEALIKMPSGKTVHIKVANNSKSNIYIQGITWNGVPYTKTYITHTALNSGGELKITMGKYANKNWGSAPEDRPSSASN